MKKIELIAYAHAYVSFVLPRIKTPIREIILFGSVARGDFDIKSDLDIFFDLVQGKDVKSLETELNLLNIKFYTSKLYELWKQKGATLPIAVKAGVLKQWELRGSVLAEGITLHSKYKTTFSGVGYMLVSFVPIKNIAQRNKVLRELFGRKEKFFTTEGIVLQHGGIKISPTVFLVPLQFSSEVISFLKQEKVNFQLREVFGLENL